MRARSQGRVQRRPAAFNLAFLDIMACGLGAIILIFMLVKYHAVEAVEPQLAEQQPELTELHAATLDAAAAADEAEAEAEELAAAVATLRQDLQTKIEGAAANDESATAAARELIASTKRIAALEKELQQKQAAAEVAPQPQPEPTPQPESGAERPQEDHLIGLRVQGKRILVLLDSSASMADELLVDIVKIKSGGDAGKRNAPKWRRARAVVRWILERVPADSDYVVAHYNAEAEFVADATWLQSGDQTARKKVDAAIAKLHPNGATNLYAGLKLILDSGINPTDIYIVTDGLPTAGREAMSGFQRARECGNRNTVSGRCRLALFYAAVKHTHPSARVNTVLLPVEGDPEAGYAYWLWSDVTTGMMISPGESWP